MLVRQETQQVGYELLSGRGEIVGIRVAALFLYEILADEVAQGIPGTIAAARGEEAVYILPVVQTGCNAEENAGTCRAQRTFSHIFQEVTAEIDCFHGLYSQSYSQRVKNYFIMCYQYVMFFVGVYDTRVIHKCEDFLHIL